MSRPYIPGIWARKYEQLPRARKDAVIREVNKIFAERTEITRKLDPQRDRKLVRVWLQIRDAVMSGVSRVASRVYLRLDNLSGSSKDPGRHGWIDVGLFRFFPLEKNLRITIDASETDLIHCSRVAPERCSSESHRHFATEFTRTGHDPGADSRPG